MDPAQAAIDAALEGKWIEAVVFNKKVLKNNASDIEALNRLARAYCELGNMAKAKTVCKKALKIDPLNTIANKTYSKIKPLTAAFARAASTTQSYTFLEEPGKTKIASLVFIGDVKVLAKLFPGDSVNLNTHAHRVVITTQDGEYVGKLTDDLSLRIRNLVSAGYSFAACIKSANESEVVIFIKEVERSSRFPNSPPFPASSKINFLGEDAASL